MYSILIVDDENLIRNGLKDLMPWSTLNINYIYTASCARDALTILKEQSIDILLTDICMPEMSGIELIEHVRPMYGDLIILVLSGYNDFEYAQQCCQLQVRDFILKPIDEEILLASIAKQLQRLEEKKQQIITNRTSHIHKTLYLEQSIRNILHQQPSNSIQPQPTLLLEEYGYSEAQATQIVLFLPHLSDIDGWQDDFENQLLTIKNICTELVDVRQEGLTFEDGLGNIGVIFFLDQVPTDIPTKIEQIKERIQQTNNQIIKSILGSKADHFSKIAISYQDTLLSLQTNSDQTTALHTENISMRHMKAFHQTFGELKMFMCNYISDRDQLMLGVKQMHLIFSGYNLSLSLVRRSCFELICAIYYAYYEENVSETNERLNFTLHALQIDNYNEVLDVTTKFILELHQHVEEETPDIINRAKQYIHQHLTDDLTVSSIASHLFVNTNYFSRLFKKNIGLGCNEYITRKRMEKAQTLLKISSMPVGEIAEVVGYTDKNYFSLAFKKFTGYSPTLYRQQIQEKCI